MISSFYFLPQCRDLLCLLRFHMDWPWKWNNVTFWTQGGFFEQDTLTHFHDALKYNYEIQIQHSCEKFCRIIASTLLYKLSKIQHCCSCKSQVPLLIPDTQPYLWSKNYYPRHLTYQKTMSFVHVVKTSIYAYVKNDFQLQSLPFLGLWKEKKKYLDKA